LLENDPEDCNLLVTNLILTY